jgi:hypothetical protein
MNWNNLIRTRLGDSESRAMNLRAVLQQVPDPRGKQGQDYRLWSILSLIAVSLLCGRRGLRVRFVDYSKNAGTEKERRTQKAMDRGELFIYGGHISVGEPVGDRDILRKETAMSLERDINRFSPSDANMRQPKRPTAARTRTK